MFVPRYIRLELFDDHGEALKNALVLIPSEVKQRAGGVNNAIRADLMLLVEGVMDAIIKANEAPAA